MEGKLQASAFHIRSSLNHHSLRVMSSAIETPPSSSWEPLDLPLPNNKRKLIMSSSGIFVVYYSCVNH